MQRRPLEVALSVFASSVTAELLCIKILRGSLTDWLIHPHRQLLLLSMILVNLLNAAAAMYFSFGAVKAEVNLKLGERRHEQIGMYLNHHLAMPYPLSRMPPSSPTMSRPSNDVMKQ